VPIDGTYWASFSTETWENSNQTNNGQGSWNGASVCELLKGELWVLDSINQVKHNINTLITGLVKGDKIILRCAQVNSDSNAKAWLSNGYLLRVDN